uniref:PPARG related coactivator 1 n=1 Tax=Chelonoidis abingdonii TaxID=106734 RepID=A0A8C0HFI5_CHEAB
MQVVWKTCFLAAFEPVPAIAKTCPRGLSCSRALGWARFSGPAAGAQSACTGGGANCFSLEEDELSLHLVPACSDAILEAEGILGTMQSYLDSSVISIIEDFGTLTENKTCLDAPNELSLLTAITEILDSTDDETLSPFDTTLDSELLALPRERECSSVRKFLSLSRASPECRVPALEDPWGLSSPAAIGKVRGQLIGESLRLGQPRVLREASTPKLRPSRVPWTERKLPRPQPLPQRSDGEEEEDTASPGQHGGMAATGGLRESPMDLCAEAGGEEAVWLEDTDTPCIISTGAGSLSELVKSMHPYCLPTLTVCLDPASEPVAKEFLSGPLLLEIVPGEGESLEIPVVLQQLGPGAQLPAEGEGASGCLPGERGGALEPLLMHGVVPVGMPAQGCETGGPIRAPQEEPPSPTQARESPQGIDPEAKDEVRQRDRDLERSSRHSTEAPVGGKHQGTEKGRGRERARKSRKKKREESQKGQAKPDGDCVVCRFRSTSTVQPPASQRSPSWAARPSVQVSTFLEKQLDQAKKEGQMELQFARGRPRAAAAGGGLQRKGHAAMQKELEAEKTNTQPAGQSAETSRPLEQAVHSPGAQGEVAPGCSEESQPAPPKGSTPPHQDLSAEGEAPQSPQEAERAGAEAAGWPSKPKALSLTEYRLRMLRRQPSRADGKEGEKQAASKWPIVPEPPTELAEIPCLMAAVRPPPSQPAQPVETPSSQRGPETPASPPATPPLARKAPAGPPQPEPAPVPPGLQLPVPPPALGSAGAVTPQASPAPYGVYPPVPSWPCFGPPPAGYPSLPLPPAAGGSPNTFHLVPGLPPPAMAWPPPALPLPPFGPGAPCPPLGWPLCLQPPYWPGIPLPPPMVYSDPGAALHSPGANPFPSNPAALAPSCQEPSAFTVQPAKPVLASQATAAAKHEVPAQTPQCGAQPSGRASDPRRQSRPVGKSPALQPVGQPPIATTQTVGESATAWPGGQPPAPWPVGQPPIATARTVGESTTAWPVGGTERQRGAWLAAAMGNAEWGARGVHTWPGGGGPRPWNAARRRGTRQVVGAPPECPPYLAGLTPPATPPHQLWKPLGAVSLLGKPGAAAQESSQRTAKFMEAKPLPQSKPRGKGQLPTTCSPPPRHVGSGDHDYCIRGPAQPEEGSRLPGTSAPLELGSRWNVKHHQDITIKPPSSLPTRTLAWPGLSPKPGAAPGSSEQLDHRTSAQTQVVAERSSPRPSVLLSPDASPCRDEEPRTRDSQPKQLAAKRSLRCYRRRGASPSPRARASRSFSSTSSGASASSSSHSRSSHSSRSSCGSCGRSRGRSSSSSSYSSRSSSASHSRSPSPRRRTHCIVLCSLQEERRVVFIGKIPSRMTRAELRHRFSVFGDIEECTLHFRAEGDNYGFVTYRYAKEAFAAIESGHKLRRPDEQPFDLCFGGRRQFCRRNYADLDSNREDFDPAPVKSKFDSLDFDTLLKQAQRKLRR